ncbi:MAG: HD domain-containing protein [Phycisphaerales bacterium]|nr:HD domain-containing protein [Phycisphaerales bacterium]
MSATSDLASRALMELNAAAAMIPLYGADHEAVRSHAALAASALQALGSTSPSVAVTFAGKHVICDGLVLACSKDVMRGIGAMFLARGANRLVLDARATPGDIVNLARFAQGDAQAGSAIRSSGIAIGHAGVASGSDAAADDLDPLEDAITENPPDAARSMEITAIWNQVVGTGRVPAEALGALAANIASAAAPNAQAMLALADIKSNDEYTYVHTVNVSLMSSALAQACGLSLDDVHDVTTAAVLHDIGKTRVPLEILNKAGKLDPAELTVMRSHAPEGARMLLAMPNIPEVAAIVAFEHHIVLDGSGYPNVGSSYRTHMASRIVQIADIFDALRTHRPYRAALPFEEARGIMTRDAGRRLDAELLQVFFDHVVPRTAASCETQAAA